MRQKTKDLRHKLVKVNLIVFKKKETIFCTKISINLEFIENLRQLLFKFMLMRQKNKRLKTQTCKS